jgi:trans-aconitate 2-methyltransferase
MSVWSPDQYERFKQERAQPFFDLMSLVEPHPSMRVVDLGCGTGEWTRKLHDHFAARETIGVDNSDSMLAKSASFAGNGLHFELAPIETFSSDQPFDLVFSNAAIHWVEAHESTFARLAQLVAPRGQLAVQMPANHDHPSHTVAAELAPQFGITPRISPLLAPEQYARLLHRLGFARQHVRLQVYGHVLDSARDVIEWVKGTTLTDYERRLGAAYPQFLDAYTERLLSILADERPYFFPFKRILMWAAR